ncbi:RecQ family ATP-dependent DNA helicase [Mucilaginibacter myungsuensis]|uniref:ATP-dependent DNA helicase RecQ n=1 Tax=Mucilaginibacter myungsuensis TaxID=649104 RepID=A0A929KUC9_9SPHI|nr:ATP-dependent DNA helicase RecQ [Mucilaginibacter myungsuensis]MBE9661736.1 RecQ family ATP-dependent DNA helicase [Mucilaginibacter myungsuensis]MDN3599832.1 ATP-dependent DNA helicase RecQ [Mucilaginibacter myungsuensis]
MTIHQILKHYWHHDNFRPVQEEVIQSVLLGYDTLALLPTGGGKSVCFQVPALAKDGICIVISPLIALMKDQVENLKAKGIQAIAIVSGMGKREVDIALDNCIYGPVKFLYLSPERLLSDLVRERIKYMKVNLFAIDEAHCISQWGYDFRPPYLKIAELRELHPKVPVLALTATATSDVKLDIQEKLHFKKGSAVFQKSFERKNLAYVVRTHEDKLRRMTEIVRGVKGSGIVYVRSRKQTFELAQYLNQHGFRADYYHAGLPVDQRSAKQDAWKTGKVPVIVATNAFGMGIDKPDVRFVIHYDLPESLEAYYQEAGRAGRDEQKAYAVLLYGPNDKARQIAKFESAFPSVDEIKTTYHYLANHFQIAYGAGEGLSLNIDIGEFCARFKLDAAKTLNAMKFLERGEYLSFSESVFLPSRFRFEVSNEELYNFRIQNAGWDAFIKVLLRSYGGAFDNYTRIKEFDVSKRTHMNVQQVVDGLKQLQGFNVLTYLPQTDQPQVTWTRARQIPDNLYIDRAYLEERKAMYKRKMEAVFAYADHNRCRSQMLLNYFDEHNAPKCGVCDVCLAEKRKDNALSISDDIAAEILELLNTAHLKLDDLIAGTHTGTDKEKIDTLRTLLDAGRIKTDGVKYYV